MSGIESEIEDADNNLQILTQKLADPALYQDKKLLTETIEAHARAKKSLEELMAEWEHRSAQSQKM